MAEANVGFVRGVEIRLLRCTLSPGAIGHPDVPPPPPPSPAQAPPASSLHPLIESLAASIERGSYAEALSSDTARRLLFGFADSWEFADTVDCADRFYGEAERSVSAFLRGGGPEAPWLQVLCEEERGGEESDLACRCVLVMCIGVAVLLAFVQRNMTGPAGDFSVFPLWSPRLGANETLNGGGNWDVWARGQLTSVGSDLLGKFSILQYIVYAKMLLSKIRNLLNEGTHSSRSGIESISWWLCRLTLLHQRILDELSSSLYDTLQVFLSETLNQFGSLKTVSSYWGSQLSEGEALAFVSMAHLEAGIVGHVYCRVDSSRVHFKCAEEASGLHLSVTGALGFRTVNQVDPKAQMVLVADTEQQKNGDRSPIEYSELPKESCTDEYQKASQSHANPEYCDILMTPRLVENGNDAGVNRKASQNSESSKEISLIAVQQAVILAQCLHIKRSNPDDELSRWEMAPFIEAIDTQRQSYFIIRCFCDILRIRWETTRSRTKQRALLMMDKLVERVFEAFPGAAQRVPLSFAVYIPAIPALRKEYGDLLVGGGMIGEALKIFEDLELWDNLIYCYQLLGKKSAAVDLIKARLTDMPNDPRLWCSLGDVTNSDAYYEKALEVSNDRSARAKRSLARSAYNRGDYMTSKVLWESAMALNSLYPDGWFALGAAALKARDIDKALDGFTRAVQLDPENGEAWNNIACLHMIKKKSKESFIAFKEALKFRRTSWQLWENYSQVAMDVGDLRQALEATKMVLDLSVNKRIDAELLETVMVKIEERTLKPVVTFFNDSGDSSCTKFSGESENRERDMERSRETDVLRDMIGEILQQIIRSGGREDIWGLYARWHKIKGNLTMCSEALLKQVRSYQGSDLWHDQERFKKFAHASLQLCKVYMEIASSTESRRELTTAEMHLRNTIKQGVNFSNTDEFRDLQACFDEVKNQLTLSTEHA